MTSDRASGDPTRPDAEDWWQGTVDLGPPPSAPTAPAGSADSAGSPRPRSRWLLGAAAGVIAVAGIGVAVLATRGDDDGDSDTEAATATGGPPGSAGPGGFAGGGGTAGTITEIDAGAMTLTIEVQDTDDTVEVRAGDDTTISETVEGSADDLAVGDDVLVVGSAGEGDDGTIAAEQVVAGGEGDLLGGGGPMGGGGFPAGEDPPEPPSGGGPGGELPEGGEPPEGFDPPTGGGPGGFTSGTIESIDEGSLTVRTAEDETVIVTLSSATTVLVSKELPFDDLAAGDEVTLTGETEDGILDAVVIRRGDGGLGLGGGRPPAGDDADAGSS